MNPAFPERYRAGAAFIMACCSARSSTACFESAVGAGVACAFHGLELTQ